LRSNRTAECKGKNDHGQATPPPGGFTKLYAAEDLSCGIRTDGSAVCWGKDDDGQLTPSSGYFIDLGVGSRHICGIATNTSTIPNAGGIVCWGYNGDGRGDPPIPSRHDYIDVDCNNNNCCALTQTGMIQCFGLTPPANPVGSDFSQLVYHEGGGCALRNTGQPHCWRGEYQDDYPPTYVVP